MRVLLFSLALLASPAAAQSAPKSTVLTPGVDASQITRVLNDPATAQRMTGVMQALSRAFLDMPAGEIEAALEGRAPTAEDKRRKVRDIGRADDPNFERDFERDVAQSGPVMQQAMKALAGALPAMIKSMEDAGRALDKAADNLPSPAYPKR